jgi:hypothetical protein
VQSEWIDVLSQRGDDERHALTHQPGDEADVAAEVVELGDAGNLQALGVLQRSCQLRPFRLSASAPLPFRSLCIRLQW